MEQEARERARIVVGAGLLSLFVGVSILCVKLTAWWVTGSSALLADGLESVVNVVAAALVTYSVVVAARPADDDHPYGHGKAEALSAAFEGFLIVLAAAAIASESLYKLIEQPELKRLGVGMTLSAISGVANVVLGLYLVRTGRRYGSEAIEADGRHILTDVVTTVGSLVALGAIGITGWVWLDPLAGLIVAANIALTGSGVVQRAVGGLLDEANPRSLLELAAALERARKPEWVDVHQLRTRASGPVRHIDLHLVVPRYFTIDRAHVVADAAEKALHASIGEQGDVVVHVDPCREWQCAQCGVKPCELRSEEQRDEPRFDVAWITRQGRL